MAENEEPQGESHPAPESEEKRFSEAAEVLQVAIQVAGPILSGVAGGVAGAVASHVLNNKPTEQAPPPPPMVELPPGVERDA